MRENALLVGTKKGLFLLKSQDNRKNWSFEGPFLPGQQINHAIYDNRTNRIWACAFNEIFGPKLSFSDNFGRDWHDAVSPKNPEEPVQRFWLISPGFDDEGEMLYVGSAPANLWLSEDGGKTWMLNEGLYKHSTRKQWEPGNGGLCLHSIVRDPDNRNRMWVGISAAGVFYSEDSGKNWEPRNRNVRADFSPDKYPVVGQCVHKLSLDAAKRNTLYQQNHCGMYRSDDGGENWIDIGEGKLPSRFGFPIASHPRKSGVIWIIPQKSDETRFTIDGKLIVYKSEDGGDNWMAKSDGLPQNGAYVSVLREAMTVDNDEPCGIYFGTTGGVLFASTDEGEHWRTISSFLPPIFSVSALSIEK